MNPNPPGNPIGSRLAFDELVLKNVETINRIEQAAQSKRTRSDRVADVVANFCGSRAFLFLHFVWFVLWLVWNGSRSMPRSLKWDAPPFNTLTLMVALEAIFLSTFILTIQNRQQKIADQRNHLDLQINMLAEQESSQMLVMMRQMMEHLGMKVDAQTSGSLEHETDTERLAEHIQEIIVEDEKISGEAED